MMTASGVHPYPDPGQNVVDDETHVRFSTDLIHWSEPVTVYKDGKPFGNHYVAAVSEETDSQPNVANGDAFAFLLNHNGTDVVRYPACFTE